MGIDIIAVATVNDGCISTSPADNMLTITVGTQHITLVTIISVICIDILDNILSLILLLENSC